jgi:hypothetical protein
MAILAVKYQISQMFFANPSAAGMNRRRRWRAKAARESWMTLAHKKKNPCRRTRVF